jgi:hypothetical protein
MAFLFQEYTNRFWIVYLDASSGGFGMRRFIITVVTGAALTGAAFAQTNSSVNGSANGTIDPMAKPGSAATANQSATANGPGMDASAAAVQSATLNAVLTKSVDAKKAKEGDQVLAKTTQDTTTTAGTKIPKNSKLIGHVTEAKARAKGETDSSLAFVFDKAVLKGGQEIPLHAVIQAIAAAPQVPMTADTGANADTGYGTPNPGPSSSMGSHQNASGGVVNSATNTVTNAANATAGTVDNTVGAAQAGVNSGAVLNANATGVVGIKDVQLQQATGASANGSVPMLSSSSGNVRLDSGTQLVLKSSGAGTATK